MDRPHPHNKLSDHGFSLVELLITIALIAIGLSLSTLAFQQMQNKSRAESQIRQMATDLSELRLRAMTNKQPSGITLNANSYVLTAYTSAFAPYSTISQQRPLPGGTVGVKFPLLKSNGTPYSGEQYEINERGFNVLTGFTVYLGGEGNSGSVDCLTVSILRINVGKNIGTSTAGVCNDR